MNDNVRVYHVDEYCEGASHFSFSERKDVVLLEDYKELQAENERLNAENAKLLYALALLRWEHAHQMETMIDLRYTIRPSSWRFYYKSKTYWYNKWQELKKGLKEK